MAWVGAVRWFAGIVAVTMLAVAIVAVFALDHAPRWLRWLDPTGRLADAPGFLLEAVVVVGALVAAALATITHGMLDHLRYRWIDAPDQRIVPFERTVVDRTVEEFEEVLRRDEDGSLMAYLTALLAMYQYRTRTVERIEPTSRTLHRRLVQEYDFHGDEPKVMPVLLLERGVIQDYREVTDGSGAPLRVLTHLESSCCAIGAIRVLLRPVGSVGRAEGLDRTVRDVIEGATAYLAPSASPATDAGDRAEDLKALRTTLQAGEEQGLEPWRLTLARDLLELHRDTYAICVDFRTVDSVSVIHLEDYEIPSRPRRDPQRKTWERRWELTWRSIRWFPRILRAVTGSRPARYWVSLAQASFSASYHLQLVGPPRTYLASQRFLDVDRSALQTQNVYDRWTSRRGQRFAHVYIRGGYRATGPITAQFGFIERPPGSLAHASVAAVTALFMALVGFLLYGSEHEEALERFGPFVAAALLTFPVAGAVWAGFSMPESFTGQMAYSRLSAAATFLLSFWSAAAIALRTGVVLTLCVALLTMNAAFITYWWILRSWLYTRLVARESPRRRWEKAREGRTGE